jgi:hypothetical protein
MRFVAISPQNGSAAGKFVGSLQFRRHFAVPLQRVKHNENANGDQYGRANQIIYPPTIDAMAQKQYSENGDYPAAHPPKPIFNYFCHANGNNYQRPKTYRGYAAKVIYVSKAAQGNHAAKQNYAYAYGQQRVAELRLGIVV